MQNITEKGVSLVFRASQGRGPQKFFRGKPPDPHMYLLRSRFAPPQKQGPGYATVKMITSLQIRGPLENGQIAHCSPLSHYLYPSTRLETLGICNSWEKSMSEKSFLDSVLLFGLERLSRSLCQAFLVKLLTVVMDRPLPYTFRSRTNLDSHYPSFIVDRLFV